MLLLGPTPQPRLADQCSARGWLFTPLTFPDASPHNEYFNPSLASWQGQDWLFTRRRRGPVGQPGSNSIEAWLLQAGKVSKRHPLGIPSVSLEESLEDPRVLVRGDNLILSFCLYLHGSPGFAHQAMTGIRPGWIVEPPISIAIGQNGLTRAENKGHEKNWTLFLHDGLLHISYSLGEGQHIVVATQGAKPKHIFYGHAPLWSWGTLRGGTCPVLNEGLFWTFFHSSTPWYCGKRRYHMGVLAFSPEPPFHVVRMARNPLLSASEMDFRHIHAPPCVWPGGAILKDGVWTVALGVNDCACALLELPHEDVERACYVTS